MNTFIKCMIGLAVLISGACERLVSIDPPKNQLSSQTVFLDSVGARGALNGLYVTTIEGPGIISGALSYLSGLSADELIFSTNAGDHYEFYLNDISVNNAANLGALWIKGYKLIYASNAIIEGITESEGIHASAQKSMVAEAKLIRGLCYFYMVNLYGAVPLVTTTDYNLNRKIGRTSVDSLYAFIEEDLKFAKEHIQRTVFSSNRANFLAAEALLAKVFLYQKKYDAALEASTNVIASGRFSLEQELSNVFLSDNKEAIWKFDPVYPYAETWDGNVFVPYAGSQPKYMITPSLYGSFDAGDKRKVEWIGTSNLNGVDYYFPMKYKNNTAVGNESYSMIRIAELYLIRAEANAKLNHHQESVADLNMIRTRAGLADYAFQNQEALILAIEKERQVELFCEWGNRWLDLKRTDRTESVLSASKAGWKATSKYYPIPQSEINLNPNLIQNEGY